MVSPFDATYTTPIEAGKIRLTEARVETCDGDPLILWRIKAAQKSERSSISPAMQEL